MERRTSPSLLGLMKLSPPVRTRLTNLAFYSVAVLSLFTVSLAMSGVGPATLPCPARSTTKVRNNDNSDWSAQHSDQIVPTARGERGDAQGQGAQGKRTTTTGRTRKWLQDPITPHSVPSYSSRTPSNAPSSSTNDTTTNWLNFTTLRNYLQSIRPSGN